MAGEDRKGSEPEAGGGEITNLCQVLSNIHIDNSKDKCGTTLADSHCCEILKDPKHACKEWDIKEIIADEDCSLVGRGIQNHQTRPDVDWRMQFNIASEEL